ncbi:NlpC/P60 family protein [Pseudaquidulcibacter saccharophilus]|uniref:NlpC/P60 family protein n=1 Tax=Pseudaquidulcibacter saccharophilus TaxID=2831900 RepID=UPI001EFF0934|nr:NlpC/P60 family protein [Pseudaquidulcibacter saccharophilus]
MMRGEIIATAREMLGTPFRVGMSLKNVGCDCAGLIEIILRQLGQEVPKRNQSLAEALIIAMDETKTQSVGDVVLFKSTANMADFHCGILTEKNTIIHAHWSQGVVENSFGNWFKKRVVAFYSFKGVE